MPSGRRMDEIDSFLRSRVDKVLEPYLRSRGENPLPIDPMALAPLAGVLAVQEIEMIPEAVLRPTTKGFEIFLQKNFAHFSWFRQRRRFSLAHEIAHTFFFEIRDGKMKPRRDGPRGDRLESACHKAARLMLVPGSLIRSAVLPMQDFPRATQMIGLARRFDVSIEVLVRRLDEMRLFDSATRALVLARGPNELIEFAVYPTWLQPVLTRPDRGVGFSAWFETRVTNRGYGSVSATGYDAGPSLVVYEITLDHSSE